MSFLYKESKRNNNNNNNITALILEHQTGEANLLG